MQLEACFLFFLSSFFFWTWNLFDSLYIFVMGFIFLASSTGVLEEKGRGEFRTENKIEFLKVGHTASSWRHLLTGNPVLLKITYSSFGQL